MKTPYALSLATAVLLAACASPTPSPTSAALVRLEVKDEASQNGKVLTGTVTELERRPDHSLIQTRIVSGGSVSTAMLALRGACAVLRARNERYGRSESVAGDTSLFKLTFPKAATAQELSGKTKSVFSADDCALFNL